MFARLMPHEGRFFTYFTENAALILQGAIELKAMMDDTGETESRAHNIKTIETKADTITYQTIQLLHQTFITPIDRHETDADQVLRSAMAKLFRNEPDTRELIKLKEIYEHLETVTDKCEDVANIIEGIVIENS